MCSLLTYAVNDRHINKNKTGQNYGLLRNLVDEGHVPYVSNELSFFLCWSHTQQFSSRLFPRPHHIWTHKAVVTRPQLVAISETEHISLQSLQAAKYQQMMMLIWKPREQIPSDLLATIFDEGTNTSNQKVVSQQETTSERFMINILPVSVYRVVPLSWHHNIAVVINASKRANVRIEPALSFAFDSSPHSFRGTNPRYSCQALSLASWEIRRRLSSGTSAVREFRENW